ncbi:DUF6036 family nucleotidyltransferase [Longimicrobium sp.]|uniref:DUF6036 family nucleotidyltransferase n=1 Tax=Longimicrobium sp. TaxID=2029185 RepID=UPI002C1593BD|nr:DUF6036 family nucleotidyltransferase [Longimicrobium sp.]HSU17875.1 DUF6036 family nucleotidyltransferase [Longimicrobium sp.]
MRRFELEHAIRAACDISDREEVVIVDSQAVLAQFPRAPDEITYSREVDIFADHDPVATDLIDGVLGEFSQFSSTHGFYVHGIGPETAVLPEGWRERLVPVRNENTRGCTGWCLEVHDVAASKLVAGREKDLDYVAALFRHAMIAAAVLDVRIAALPVPEDRRAHLARVAARLAREAAAGG